MSVRPSHLLVVLALGGLLTRGTLSSDTSSTPQPGPDHRHDAELLLAPGAALLLGSGLIFSSGLPPLIAASCPQFPGINAPGVLCEDFDTNRNAAPGMQFTRLPLGADPIDPSMAIGDPADDVLGYTQIGGPAPLGADGQQCSSDVQYNQPTCSGPVSVENDWHLHTAVASENSDPGMNAGYQPTPGNPSYAPDGGKAHSGLRSMHWGRHTNKYAGTLGDTLRFRQVSAFVMDPPVNLGASSTLEFWQIMQVPDDDNFGFVPPGTSFGGGQVQISLLGAEGLFEKWQTLRPSFNGYNSIEQDAITICGFDPGDDQGPSLDETMCEAPMWSEMGSPFGTDAACTAVAPDGTGYVDCGEISSCTGNTGAAPWPAPGGENCAENGSVGAGVWVRSAFDLSPFAGRRARLRWISMMGGGWSFGISRSFLETPAGAPYQYFEIDDGWWIDDIVLTDLWAVSAAGAVPDGNTLPGTPLTVTDAGGGDITLSWGTSCAGTDEDYEIYEGDLGDFASHSPRFCSTGGERVMTFTPGVNDHYYLVVPRNALREGSYGTDSNRIHRPPSGSACAAQAIIECAQSFFCGDGMRNGAEVCDGPDLGGHTCQTLGWDAGALACESSCAAFDSSGCSDCGNGVREGPEQCDGPDLGGQTCQSRGFGGGTLSCLASCAFDFTQCTTCGNNSREGSEVCDGTDLAGQTCQTLGYATGALSCTPSCDGFISSDCSTCGNGTREGAEQCDGSDLAGQTCESQGYAGGTLECDPATCTFNFGLCWVP